METSIYRFTSFEAFEDLVLRKKLCLVHPTLWDDPKELEVYNKACEEDIVTKDPIGLLQYKTYAQSWTQVNESDAMWRIYSYNNMSIRIHSSIGYFNSVKGLDIRKVIYTNDVENTISKFRKQRDFLQLLAIKRKFFEHEKEIRLIHRYKYKDEMDIKRHLEAFWLLKNRNFMDLKQYNEIMLQKYNELINIDIDKKIYEISVDVSDMIKDVMLNPFAPVWFEKTVELFCRQYGITFLGKSKMY